MKLTFLLAGGLLAASTLLAQTTTPDTAKYWNINGGVSLNLNQVGLSNWQGGGEASLSATVLYKGNFNYKKNKVKFESYADLAYGLIRQGTRPLTKSDDRWEIGTRYGYQTGENWDANVFVTVRSQFDEGFDPTDTEFKISDFMSPGYILAGAAFNYSKSDWLNINLSPVTTKITIVANDSIANIDVPDANGNASGTGKYGTKTGENVRGEFGAFAKITITKEIIENVKLNTTADFFSDYLNNFGNIDVNWNLTVLMQVNKYLTATVTTNLIYDDDIAIVLEQSSQGVPTRIGPAVQFKETVGVGLTLTY
jgi:hypothetical protein